jgi:hypothetical protein
MGRQECQQASRPRMGLLLGFGFALEEEGELRNPLNAETANRHEKMLGDHPNSGDDRFAGEQRLADAR